MSSRNNCWRGWYCSPLATSRTKLFVDVFVGRGVVRPYPTPVTEYMCTCVHGNTPLRLSTFRLLQVRLVYYAFYNFAFYNFAWNVQVRHLVYLKNAIYNVAHIFTVSFLMLSVNRFPGNVMCNYCYRVWRKSRRILLRSTACGANAVALSFPCDNGVGVLMVHVYLRVMARTELSPVGLS